ncbi:hypothetical protein [Synechococcus sp. 1G10]|uniref:hypothetical protein n=1 Tax=Synechococcus sp. 1G10 TaxID=2025605 RepID=UPI00117CF596|nr:hypothetical protein [Synechococcus sp. 1G10]
MGVEIPRFMAPMSPELECIVSARKFAEVDAAGPLQRGVTFPGVDGLRSTVMVLTHPSLRHLNIDRRRYAGQQGHSAELALLRDATA